MKIDWSVWLLLVLGLSLVSVGGIYWYAPDMMYRLYGAQLTGGIEHHLARTGFGGLHIAIGAGLLAGVASPRLRTRALELQALYLAGIVFGRLGSFLLDGMPTSPVIVPEFVVEASLLIITVGLLRRASRPSSA